MKWRSMLIGLLVSAVCLYLAVRQVDVPKVLHGLAAADHWLLLPASLLTILAFAIRAVRWGVLLFPLKPIRFGPLFSATMIGFMSNNVLPMRLGEFVRAWVIGRFAGIRGSAALATIVVERLFDLFSMIAIFVLTLFLAPIQNRQFKTLVLIGLLFGVVVLAGLLVLHLRGQRLGEVLGRFFPRRVRPRVGAMFDNFQAGLEIFRDPGRLAVTAGLTFLMWACFAVVIRICLASAHVVVGGQPLSISADLVLLVVIGIGIMVPSGPGFIGTMELAAVKGLEIVGYRESGPAGSFAIIYHATQWFPIVLVGLIYLMKENLSLAQVGRLAGREPDSADGWEPPPRGAR